MAVTIIVQTDEGVAGANVYDDVAGWVQFLGDHQKPAFVAKDPETQARIAIEATELGEDQVRPRVDQSAPVEDDQILLFPRDGALDRRQHIIDGLPPIRYRTSFILLGELLAASKTGKLNIGRPRAHVLREKIGPWESDYRDEDVTFAELYTEVWNGLSFAFPEGLRQKRA